MKGNILTDNNYDICGISYLRVYVYLQTERERETEREMLNKSKNISQGWARDSPYNKMSSRCTEGGQIHSSRPPYPPATLTPLHLLLPHSHFLYLHSLFVFCPLPHPLPFIPHKRGDGRLRGGRGGGEEGENGQRSEEEERERVRSIRVRRVEKRGERRGERG